MNPLEQQADSIRTREGLAAFILAVRQDLLEHGNTRDWENPTHERFLEAVAGWTVDMDGWFRHHGQPVPDQPTWQLIGEMLLAAKIYE